MPQLQLPVFPAGTTSITPELAFEKRDGMVVYLNGHLPVFQHAEGDLAAFRLFTTQLIVNGTASQQQIATAFGVPLVTVKRCCKKLRERGPSAFFVAPARRSGRRLTPDVLVRAQALLDAGAQVAEVSAAIGVLQSTIRKAIGAGRLRRSQNKSTAAEAQDQEDDAAGDGRGTASATKAAAQGCDAAGAHRTAEADGVPARPASSPVTTKTERSAADSRTPMGVATGRTLERVAAAVGMLDSAPPAFEPADDIPMGGVLCALPALLSLGLLRHARDTFSLPKGFYPIETIFLTMGYVALARVPSLEALRYQAPGEWGKLVGFDRIPEVKTMREKLSLLCDEPGRAQRWSGTLAAEWMKAAPEAAGTLYVDGHVRVYNGGLTKLPRRYVARQKLFLRGTTDYWVNAMDGQPFFVVTRPVDPGLITVLREEIVPRLERDVPDQPGADELRAQPHRSRFTLVFDRAGYSPAFFAQMRERRVAVLSYHKFPGDDWPAEEFGAHEVVLVNGEKVSLALAERGTRLSNGLWVREVRRLDTKGHQTSVLTTDYERPAARLAAAMFARWCQENFFKYMLEHYGLDRLVEYGLAPLPDTTRVVNPTWRKLDSAIRSETAKLSRERAEFGAMHLQPAPSTDEASAFEQCKGTLLQSIEARGATIEQLKQQRREAGKHVLVKDLPEADRFSQLKTDRKHLVDTIKLVAYRAETLLVSIAREALARSEQDARAWVRGLLQSTVDLRPDPVARTLTVSVHRQASAAQDAVLLHVCAELNDTETIYPGTDLRLVYQPVGVPLPLAGPDA
jgi:hypothetical protein